MFFHVWDVCRLGLIYDIEYTVYEGLNKSIRKKRKLVVFLTGNRMIPRHISFLLFKKKIENDVFLFDKVARCPNYTLLVGN